MAEGSKQKQKITPNKLAAEQNTPSNNTNNTNSKTFQAVEVTQTSDKRKETKTKINPQKLATDHNTPTTAYTAGGGGTKKIYRVYIYIYKRNKKNQQKRNNKVKQNKINEVYIKQSLWY